MRPKLPQEQTLTPIQHLVHLHKRIFEDTYSLSELMFHSQTLHERYQEELWMIFNDHAGIMTPINVELASRRALTESHVSIEYQAKLTVLLSTAFAVRDELHLHLLHDLTGVQTQIEALSEASADCQHRVSKVIDFFVNSKFASPDLLSEHICTLELRCGTDLANAKHESVQKYERVLEDGRRRFADLDLVFHKSVADLQKKFLSSSSARIDVYGSFLARCRAKSREADDLRKTIFAFFNDNDTLYRRNQRESKTLLSLYRADFSCCASAYASEAERVRAESHDLDERLRAHREARAEQARRFDGSVAGLRRDLERAAAEAQRAGLRCAAEPDWGALRAANEAAARAAAERNAAEERLASLAIACLERRIAETRIAGAGELEGLVRTLADAVRGHERERRTRIEDHEIARRYEMGEFGQTRSDLLAQSEKNADEVSHSKYVCHSLAETLQLANDEFADGGRDAQSEIDRERVKLGEQIEEAKRCWEAENNERMAALSESVRRRAAAYTTLVLDRRSHIEIGNGQAMDAARMQLAADGEVESVLREYQRAHKEVVAVLNAIAPPQTDGSESANCLATTENERVTILREIENNRPEITRQWSALVEGENARHRDVLDSIGANVPESLFEDSFRAKLCQMDSDIHRLTLELEQGPRNRPNSRESSVNEDSLIVNLLADLARTKEASDAAITEALDNRVATLAAARRELDHQTNVYFKNLEEAKVALAAELREKADRISAAESELSATTESGLRELSRQLGTFQLGYQARKAELTATKIKLQSKVFKCQTAAAEVPRQARVAHSEQSLKERKPTLQKRTPVAKRGRTALLDEMVALATDHRNQAKATFLQRRSRGEELDLVEALEERLNFLNQQLTQHTRDLIAFRAKLQTQEDAYNARFGPKRTIAVSVDGRVRRASAFGGLSSPKVLPPLLS
jgi:hypothetical protein